MKFGFRTLAKFAVCIAATAIFAAFTSVARADDAPDTSTPKKAAVAFANAVTAGDMDAAHNCRPAPMPNTPW